MTTGSLDFLAERVSSADARIGPWFASKRERLRSDITRTSAG